MSNIKVDLIRTVKDEKYYGELELLRLAQDGNMNYRSKISSMNNILRNISIYNAQLGLIDQYFRDVPDESEEIKKAYNSSEEKKQK